MTESKMNYEGSITHFWSLKALIVSFLLQLLSRFLLILIVVITPPLATAALNTADSIFSLATCLNAVTVFIVASVVSWLFRFKLPTIKQQIVHAVIPTVIVGLLSTGVYLSWQAAVIISCRLLLWVITSIAGSSLIAARIKHQQTAY